MVSRDWLPPVLRATATVVIALCVVAMVFGQLPGTEIYRDSRDCFGQALGQLFSAHGGGGHSRCEPHYELLRTEPAGGWQLLLALAPVVLGGLAVRKWPRPLIAGLWPLGAFVLLVVGALLALQIEIFSLDHKVTLWPSIVVSALIGFVTLIMLVLFIAMPIIGVRRVIERRRAARERIPAARVV